MRQINNLSTLMRPFIIRSMTAAIITFVFIALFMTGEAYISVVTTQSRESINAMEISKLTLQDRFERFSEVMSIMQSSPEIKNLIGFKSYGLQDDFNRQLKLLEEFFSYFQVFDSGISKLEVKNESCVNAGFYTNGTVNEITQCRHIGAKLSISMTINLVEVLKSVSLPEGIVVVSTGVQEIGKHNIKLGEKINLSIRYSGEAVWNSLKPLVLRVLAVTLLSTIMFCTLLFLIIRYYHRDLHQIVDAIANAKNTSSGAVNAITFKNSAFAPIVDALNKLIETSNISRELEAQARIGEIARQVAHDIRSPLSALEMVVYTSNGLPEEKRVLVRSATQRIKDIANGLISLGKSPNALVGNENNVLVQSPSDNVMMSALLESVLSEKRTQYREKVGIDIVGDFYQGYGLFAKVNSVELSRVISNLINNAVEAINDTGRVVVSICGTEEKINIVLSDNGCGIPNDILNKLGRKGFSYGKQDSASGSGLGLFHAKQVIEGYGGSLTIDSTINKGTSVRLTLSRTEPPNWFIDKIDLRANSCIVSVDDDLSIHQIWAERINSSASGASGIRHISFSSANEFINWVKLNSNENDIYLIDYEFVGQDICGLDIIEKTGLVGKAILVTSRYDEPGVRMRAESLGVKILPKGLAPIVPM